MKKLLALAVAAVVVAILAIPAFAATKKVAVRDNYFVHKTGAHKVTIKKGSKVKWVWGGKNKHNVYQVDGPGHFHSPDHQKSGTFTHKFTQVGTYKFICSYQNMKMTVKVK